MTEQDRGTRVPELTSLYGEMDGAALLRPFIENEFPGRIALVSSFGTEAAVLLHIVAEIDRDLPVIFLDTGKLFGETLRYRDALVRRLGLTDLRIIKPAPEAIAAGDPDGVLWHGDPDACCALRKVAPLRKALAGFDAWISGRKRYQGALRAFLPVIEASGEKIKINPLARWSKERIDAEFAARDLPHHPLEEDGFLSIGCMPCTQRAPIDAGPRGGRWAGREKTECGIHL
ncbi:MAG: phosphoadenosine phosphosulfate reductase [Rhodospirillaceae bacterium]|jgi:phosphoadenosine phosphosulfate reductase|nr:phosphoadenosine phosphosulfate reductase [Rhodospirillaceae bacterium]